MENKYLTHKQRIKNNYEKFESGQWNKFSYSHDFGCSLTWVEQIMSEIISEKLECFRWEKNASGVPLPSFEIIKDPETIEIHPDRIIDHGTKVELIYKSKI